MKGAFIIAILDRGSLRGRENPVGAGYQGPGALPHRERGADRGGGCAAGGPGQRAAGEPGSRDRLDGMAGVADIRSRASDGLLKQVLQGALLSGGEAAQR